jgi:hypothetical protein
LAASLRVGQSNALHIEDTIIITKVAALLYLQSANNQTEEMLEVNNSLKIVKCLYGFQKQLSCHSFQEAKRNHQPIPLAIKETNCKLYYIGFNSSRKSQPVFLA